MDNQLHALFDVGVITHPCPNFKGSWVKPLLFIKTWMSNYIPHKTRAVATYPTISVNKRSPRKPFLWPLFHCKFKSNQCGSCFAVINFMATNRCDMCKISERKMKSNLGEKDEISTEFKLYLKSNSQNHPQWRSEMLAIIYHNTVADLGKKAWLNNF